MLQHFLPGLLNPRQVVVVYRRRQHQLVEGRAMRLTAAVAGLVLVAAVPAAADDRPRVCAVIVDDQRGLVETTAGDRWRDLLSASVGSDRRYVTVALRLAALPPAPSSVEHATVDYTMRFTVRGRTAFLTAPAHAGAAGSYGVEIGFRPVVLGEARVVRDRTRQELRVTAPVAAFAPFVDARPGALATNLNAHVAVTPALPSAPAVVRPQTLVVDGADGGGDETYRLGARSCVPVAR
jgi:hypothetical protein